MVESWGGCEEVFDGDAEAKGAEVIMAKGAEVIKILK